MELQRRDILHRFIQDTGARPDSAQDILDRCNWDYRRALEMFSPSHHQPSSGSSNYGYPPTATIRHVPIVYVGSANQTQDLLPPSSGNRMNLGVGSASTGNKNNPKYATSQQQNHIGNPSQPSAKIKSIGDYGGSHYGSYGVNRSSPNNSDIHIRSYSAQPSHLNQSGYSNTQTTKPMGQNITSSTGPIVSMRPVHVTTQGPHTVTTPTATRPTPSHQPPQQVPFGNTCTGWPVSTSTSVGPRQNQVRSVSKVSPSHNPGVHVQDLRAPRVDLPVSVEVPITHLKSESRVSQQPIIGATLVTVAPVEAQASQTLQSARSPTDLREGSTGPPLPYNSVSSQKAPLVRSNATEVGDEGRVLKRGISKTSDNVSLVDRARDVVLHDIRESAEDHVQYFVDTPELTFILPDLTVYSEDFRGFLEKDLIETATLISLEQAGCLNWWAEVGVCQRLHPMATTGDGNCLLHAASLAMWGFHDRDLILRKALYNSMTSGAFHGALFRQWRYQQTQVNKQTGLIYSEKEWKEEWENLLRLASTEPRRTNTDRGRDNSCCESPVTQGASSRHSTVVYESLEEFHVFVLAHVLRRPIVVVADKVLRDTNGEALAPIPFGGIYLPTGCLPQNCHRTPLLLTYDAAHFSALVPMKSERSPDDLPHLPVAMPILDPNYDLLPLHFAVEPGEHFDWSSLEGDDVPSTHLTIRQKLDLIEKYMNLVKLPFTRLEGDHDSDQRSNGSVDSDESAGSGCKEKRKDKKLQQQMHSVSKQFGSLGRSMGKKIKKNFNIGKSKGKINFDKENTGSKNPTIATGVTQSTKLTASIPIMFDQEQVILCAQLSAHRSEMHEQLVNNYLTEAKKRFEADRDLKRQKGVELRSRIPQKETFNKDLDKVPVKCVTPGCSMYGTASCSYLCSDCFVRSKKQALEQVPSSDRPFAYNTYPGPRSQTAIPFSSDHMYKMECGKSKFYAPVAAEENVELRNPDKKSLQPAISNVLSARPASAGAAETRSVAAGNTTIRKPLGTANHVNLIDDSLMTDTRRQTRTPSPVCHYDNVEYNDKKQQNAITASDTTDHKQCRSPLCTFYGSEATNYYCSKCFKEQQRAPLVQPEIPQTRL